MMTPRLLAALVLLVCLAITGAAQAVGPLDGVYALTASDGEGTTPYALHLVVIQNGDQVGIAFLDPDYADYHYGFGTLDAEQRLQGALFFADGSQVGTFSLRFVGARAEGSQALSYGEGYTSTLSGPKVF
jgi:hypothetical protein